MKKSLIRSALICGMGLTALVNGCSNQKSHTEISCQVYANIEKQDGVSFRVYNPNGLNRLELYNEQGSLITAENFSPFKKEIEHTLLIKENSRKYKLKIFDKYGQIGNFDFIREREDIAPRSAGMACLKK